jgi:hypothetical protein
VAYCATWRTDHKTAVILAPGAEAKLRRFIDNLIESREYVISKLDLGDWLKSYGCHTDGKPSNSLLTKRCVKNSLRTMLTPKIETTSKNATKCDILTEVNDLRIPLKSVIHG